MDAVSERQAVRDTAVLWMNCGEALVRRGDREAIAGALAAYTEAVDLLRGLPVAAYPSWANSLGAALMNQGQLTHRTGGREAMRAAMEMFDASIVTLRPVAATGHTWARRNLAGALLNRSNLHLDLAHPGPARCDATEALDLVRDAERVDAVDADIALKARRAICDAIGQEIPAHDAAGQEELAALASDVVDDAVALVRFWQARDPSAFSELALRFLRFGAELYRRHQPHFLVEFLEETAGTAPSHRGQADAIARAALDGALADGASPGRFTLGERLSERALETRSDLQAARSQLPVSVSPA